MRCCPIARTAEPPRLATRFDGAHHPIETRGVRWTFRDEGPPNAIYLVRLDDACPTMPRNIWDRLERVLDASGVSPLVAVIPDNRDPKMLIDDPDPGFWDRVRRWQTRGWAVGVHGLHHVTHRRRGRSTEFAGLPTEHQRALLDQALATFAHESVRPDAWIAPNHSFDRTTVEVLASRGLTVISDGDAVNPYRDRMGVLRVPQQLWRFQERPAGVWTVCRHPNGWDAGELERFEHDLGRFSDRTTELASIVQTFSDRRRDARDLLFSARRWAKGSMSRTTNALIPDRRRAGSPASPS